MEKYCIFSFVDGPPNIKRNLYRKIYGYKAHGKKYTGLIKKLKGLRLGAGALIFHSKNCAEVKELFKELALEVKIFEVYSKKKIC